MSNFYVKYKWGKWEEATEIDGVEVLEILKQQETRITKLEAEIKGLHTTMMAAAVEIQEHWDAHCDEDGYGPANLMRRLEHGIDGGYGYSAKTFAQMDDRIVALKARIAKQIEVVRQARQALEREATVTPIGNHRRRNGSTRRRHLRRTGGIMTPERLEIVLSVLRKWGTDDVSLEDCAKAELAISIITTALAAPSPEPAGEPDPADIIAGALQCSRGYAPELMRNQLAAPAPEPVLWHDPAYDLTMRLCAIGVVDEKDGYELIRRDSVMDFVTRWRAAREKMPTPYTIPPDTSALQARITKLEARIKAQVDMMRHARQALAKQTGFSPWLNGPVAVLDAAIKKEMP